MEVCLAYDVRNYMPKLFISLQSETERAEANKNEAQLIDRNAAAIQREYELEIKKIKTELDECKSRAEAAEREVMQLRSNRDYWKNYANTLADEREKLIDFNNKICEAVERMDKKIEEIKIANGGG